jgi:hypothetical protein
MLMDSNDRTVDENLFKIDVFGQFLEYLGPNSALLPTGESLVHAVALPELLRKIAPRRADARKPDNRLHKEPIVGTTLPGIRRVAGYQVLNPLPLVIAQMTPNHFIALTVG